MKPGVLVLLVSVTCNVVALGLLAWRPPPALVALRRTFQTAAREAQETAERAQRESAAAARSKLAAERATARETLVWRAIATDDPRTLLANLRAAGFPPEIVRAIATARINERYGRRWKEIEGPPDRPFWQAPAKETPQQIAAWGEAMRERTQALRELLAGEPAAEAEPGRTDYQRWQFGELSQAKIDLLNRINSDYQDLTRQIESLMEDVALPEDRAALALLEREKRADLATVLSAEELADYELRTSRVIGVLRPALTLMGATESEFRAIFALQQKLEERFPRGDGDSWQQRNEAQLQLLQDLKGVLGEARAADFARTSDYGFQEIARVVERENLPPEAAVRTYELRNRTAAESVRIIEDPAMSYEQKVTAMQRLADSTKAQLAVLLGPGPGAAYAGSAIWIKAISNGTGVKFKGTTTMFPTIPRTPPRPAR